MSSSVPLFKQSFTMNCLGRFIVGCCASWVLLFLLTAGTPFGKAFYKSFINDKAGTPVVGYLIPIFIASSVASLFSIRQQHDNNTNYPQQTKKNSSDEANNLQTFWNSRIETSSAFVRISMRLWRKISAWVLCKDSVKSEPDFGRIGFRWLFLPLLLYTVLSMIQKVSEANDKDTVLKEVGNTLGIGAIVALGILLIPVAKHSALLEMWGWNAAAAVQLHVWIGRFVIFGGLGHGASHMTRWRVNMGHHLIHIMLPPPLQCWANIHDEKYEDEIQLFLDDSDAGTATCYDLFRYWTGFVAIFCLTVIAITTLHPIRRRWYALFYSIHVVAGPLMLIFTILHWNRSMVYVAGSSIYYIAMSFPTVMESWGRRMKCNCNGAEHSSLEIVSVDTLQDHTNQNRSCVSLTFAATPMAIARFRPGQYIKLKAPSISPISHPFTVNTVHKNGRSLRVIFRTTGRFTRDLSAALNKRYTAEKPNGTNHLPIYMEGFHGPNNRTEQVMQHDVAVLVAAGIGITPYLSLLHAVQREAMQGIDATSLITSSTNNATVTVDENVECVCQQKIILHWVCRDEALIEYIKQEYFEPLFAAQKEYGDAIANRLQIKIVIHKTSSKIGSKKSSSYSDLEKQYPARECDDEAISSLGDNKSKPFLPSKFEVGSSKSYIGNTPSFLSSASISWVGFYVVWYFYISVQEKEGKILARLYSPLFLVVFGFLVSGLVNYIFEFGRGSDHSLEDLDTVDTPEWTALKTTEESNSGLEQEAVRGQLIDEDDNPTLELGRVDQHSAAEAAAYGIGKPWCSKEPEVSSSDQMDAAHFCGSPPSSIEGVPLEEREGRPTVHQFVNCLDGATSPGLFACGPSKFLSEIRGSVAERCLVRCRQCLGEDPTIAMYEEAFEM